MSRISRGEVAARTQQFSLSTIMVYLDEHFALGAIEISMVLAVLCVRALGIIALTIASRYSLTGIATAQVLNVRLLISASRS